MRWWVCALLFFATLLNYLDRQTLSYLIPHIRDEMKFDLERQGYLFSVFYWSYAAAQIAAGFIVDRFKVKRVYAVAVAAWSLAGAAASLATGLWSLMALRALLGVFESAHAPGSSSDRAPLSSSHVPVNALVTGLVHALSLCSALAISDSSRAHCRPT